MTEQPRFTARLRGYENKLTHSDSHQNTAASSEVSEARNGLQRAVSGALGVTPVDIPSTSALEIATSRAYEAACAAGEQGLVTMLGPNSSRANIHNVKIWVKRLQAVAGNVQIMSGDSAINADVARWNSEASSHYDFMTTSAAASIENDEQPAEVSYKLDRKRSDRLDQSDEISWGSCHHTSRDTKLEHPSQGCGSDFTPSWLRLRCEKLPTIAVDGDGLSAAEICMTVLTMLTDKERTSESLQGDLFDTFGGDFEAVCEVLDHRDKIIQNADTIIAECSQLEELRAAGIDSFNTSGSASTVSVDRRHDPSTINSMFSIRTSREIAAAKQRRKDELRAIKAGLLPAAERRGRSRNGDDDSFVQELGGSVMDELEKAFPGIKLHGDTMIGARDRVGLPAGASRIVGKGFEEISVPPMPSSGTDQQQLVSVKEALCEHTDLLDVMQGISTLNALQSAVFPIAYKSNENMLVCAPTGAGKTNVALLTVLREIVSVRENRKDGFKVVYVAPMKALAAEVVEKFGKRLRFLGLKVREFTGDMSLTRKEATETHVLVTTPEKWDVVTRKSGSELGDSVTLFIIDEVHLLHDDRGAVLESIVARTLRLSEAAQRVIRLVGLSATLPNYADVAKFLRVNPKRGMFHFDGSHRPVPLKQTFVGVSDSSSNTAAEARTKRNQRMTELAWSKVVDVLRRDHQGMVFVHSRKATVTTARELARLAANENAQNLLLGVMGDEGEIEQGDGLRSIPSWATKEIAKSRTNDVRELCSKGIGIHHAGLSRPDRKLVERLFAEGVLRLLCCTATLAWGVNLPARAVIILGTDVYDAQKGSFVQLGMLDVMQIFGRAGRPQFDTEGEGTIITKHENLSKYLNLLTSSIPIESTLGASASILADHLNAEIVSGTVSSIGDGVTWLSYTYLSVRMAQNPLVYGINWEEVAADPGLHSRRATLIEQAARALDDARMCRFDPRTGSVAPTDLGRVASYFYVSHRTIVLWNELLSSMAPGGEEMSDHAWEEMDATVLHAVSCASEFEQMRSREEELDELDQLAKECCPVRLKANPDSREGKVNVLLQAYISRASVRLSDLSYVAQSCTRLLRALFEVALRRGLPSLSLSALELARASELRVWPFQHPLWQVSHGAIKRENVMVHAEIIDRLEKVGVAGELLSLRDMDKSELTGLLRSPKNAEVVQRAISVIPTMDIVCATVAPITRTVLSIKVTLSPTFTWRTNVHGNSESWWLWLEDHVHGRIYHSERIVLTKQRYLSCCDKSSSLKELENGVTENVGMTFSMIVPVFDPPSRQYWVRVESERWHTGGGSYAVLSLRNLAIPQKEPPHTVLLDLRPLQVSSVLPKHYAALYRDRFAHFNPVQTQIFHSAYHTCENMLIGAPTGSGKTVMAELAMFRAFETFPEKCVVYIAPLKALVRERMQDWKTRLESCLGKTVVELTGDVGKVDSRLLSKADVIVATPEKWDGISRKWRERAFVRNVSLLILDEVHLLGSDRGPVLEVIVSRARRLSVGYMHLVEGVKSTEEKSPPPSTNVRIVALSTALANARELADWLGVRSSKGLFNFRPSVRPVPCEVHVVGVAGERYCPRMQSMNRPAYSAIMRYSPTKPVLVFVSSRRQTRLTAVDLARLASAEGTPNRFLATAPDACHRLSEILPCVNDAVLRETLSQGIGIHHAGLVDGDRRYVEELFASGSIQILVSTATLAWGVNLPAHLVVVKGTEYFDAKQGRYVDMPVTDLLQMIGRAGRPQYDTQAFAMLLVHEPKKTFLKKFLYEPFPVESSLHEQLTDHINAEIAARTICTPQDAIDYLTWTYLFRRVVMNPGYYGVAAERCSENSNIGDDSGIRPTAKDISTLCSSLVSSCISQLAKAGCITVQLSWMISEEHGRNKESNKSKFRFIDESIGSQHPAVTREAHVDGAAANSFLVVSTALGQIAAQYYLSHVTVSRINKNLKAEMTHEEMLSLLTSCEEFAHLPVRHNEDKVNSDFAYSIVDQLVSTGVFLSRTQGAQALDWESSPGSPATKAKLLLYGHLARVNPPVVDYVTDLKSTMEQAGRVLQAIIDIASERGIFSSVLACFELSQMLYQGRITSESSFNSLADKWNGTCDVAMQQAKIKSIGDAATRYEDTLSAISATGAGKELIADMKVALKHVPILIVSAALYAAEGIVSVHLTRKEPDCLRGIPDKSFGDNMNARKGAFTTSRNIRPRDDSWAILLRQMGTDTLIALKRVGALKVGSHRKVQIRVPDDICQAMPRLRLTVVNDSYIGTDQDVLVEPASDLKPVI